MLAANTVLVPVQLFNWLQETLWNVKKKEGNYDIIRLLHSHIVAAMISACC